MGRREDTEADRSNQRSPLKSVSSTVNSEEKPSTSCVNSLNDVETKEASEASSSSTSKTSALSHIGINSAGSTLQDVFPNVNEEEPSTSGVYSLNSVERNKAVLAKSRPSTSKTSALSLIDTKSAGSRLQYKFSKVYEAEKPSTSGVNSINDVETKQAEASSSSSSKTSGLSHISTKSAGSTLQYKFSKVYEEKPSTSGVNSSNDVETKQREAKSSPSTSKTLALSHISTRSAGSTLQYKFSKVYTEDPASQIFCVQFNHLVKNISVFACCGVSRVSIYECPANGNLKFLQAYADKEVYPPDNKKEQFFTCAWSYHEETGKPILAVAGLRGVIRILETSNMMCSYKFIGHSDEINEVKFHPNECTLLLSASKDHSVRLWNVRTFVCVAIFHGEPDGHRDSVLSIDIHMDGDKFVSCGMDHAVKFWSLKGHKIKRAIARSRHFDTENNLKSFPTYHVYYPDRTTREVHANYIDCIRWFGDFIISKSNDDLLMLWKNDDENLVHEIICENCDLWFLKFSMNHSQQILALGNRTGKIFVWDLNVSDPANLPRTTLSLSRCKGTIRHTGLNRDGTILIGVGDDGTIWRWDRVMC